MNRILISRAISGIELSIVSEGLSVPETIDRTPERTIPMRKCESKSSGVRSRRLFALALAACLIFALAATAYAVHYFLGIRDMEKNLPVEVEPHIQQHTEAVGQEDWSAIITESFCDETKIMVTVTISGGDKYIIAPTDADPDTLAVNIGIESDMTLGEYAAQLGKHLLFVGASLKQNESLGGNSSQSFHNTSDSEMAILITADKTAPLTENDIICHVYAVDEKWERRTLDIPFCLAEAPSKGNGDYIPDDPDAVPGMTVGNARITETPLGTSIRYMVTVTDEDQWYDIKKVEFDGLDYGEGGTVLEDDGNWWFTVSRCAGTVGDTLTARYYDWDDQLVATIEFKR